MTVQGRAELTIAPKDPPPQAHNHYSKPPHPEYHPYPKGQPILAQSMYLRQHPPQQKAKNMAPSPPTAPKAPQPRGLSPKEVKGSHPGSITHGTPIHPQPLVSVAVSGGRRFDVLKATQGLEGKGGYITTGTPIHDSKGARAQQLYEAVSQRASVEIIPRETYAQSPYRLPLPPATRQEGRRPRQPPTPPRPTTRHNTRGTPTRGRSSLTTSSPVGERRTHGLAHLAALRQGPFAQRETLPAGPPKGPRPRASWTTGQP